MKYVPLYLVPTLGVATHGLRINPKINYTNTIHLLLLIMLRTWFGLQVGPWTVGESVCDGLIQAAVNQVENTSDVKIQRKDCRNAIHIIPDVRPNCLRQEDQWFDRDDTADSRFLEQVW